MPAPVPAKRSSPASKGAAAKKAKAALLGVEEKLAKCNQEYFVELSKRIDIIEDQWPNLKIQNPLDERDGGFLAPLNCEAYNRRFADEPAGEMEIVGAMNFMWQDLKGSVMPHVPIYLDRVLELAEAVTPSMLKKPLVMAADFDDATQLPRGGLTRMSPDEQAHAVVFKISDRLLAKCDDAEKEKWKRMVLSTPSIFKKMQDSDAKYAEANSLRMDVIAEHRAVKHTPRQLVRNVYGFKLKKETTVGPCGALTIAQFWKDNVRIARGCEFMTKKSSIDACITVYERLFSVADLEQIIAAFENKYGLDAWTNSLWVFQEIVYRCGTEVKISWFIKWVADSVYSERIKQEHIKVATVKTGGSSISDVALTQLLVKKYVLGSWLDGMDYPPYVKKQAREIFDSFESYRARYSPIDVEEIIDKNWLFEWPPQYVKLLEFIEATVYLPTETEQSQYRQAVKNNNTAEEFFLGSLGAVESLSSVT